MRLARSAGTKAASAATAKRVKGIAVNATKAGSLVGNIDYSLLPRFGSSWLFSSRGV